MYEHAGERVDHPGARAVENYEPLFEGSQEEGVGQHVTKKYPQRGPTVIETPDWQSP